MTAETSKTTTSRVRRSRVGLHALVLIAAAGGLYAGARWHGTLAPMLGIGHETTTGAGGADKADRGAAQQLWTCGMHPQVIQDRPGDCPICHMKLTPLNVDAGDAGGQTHDHSDMSRADSGGAPVPGMASDQGTAKDRTVKNWRDPMLSPPNISDKPGKSPMGMDLVPVYEDEVAGSGSQVTIDPAVVQNMGVRVAMVTEGPLHKSVRLVGYLDEAQPNIRDINLRVSGWVRRLYVNTEGQHVEAGDPLFDLYSPELQVAVVELIAARRAQGSLASDAGQMAQSTATTLYDAGVRKLELFGLERAQIDALAKLDKAPETVTFTSPMTGHITEKPIVEGAAVKTGDRVLRIVDHTTLWLDAQVFEKDLPFVEVGQEAIAMVASRPNEAIEGQVIFIHPHVDPMTRAAMVRLAIPNASLALKPGMYATVRTRSPIADRAVLAPREAIIDTGEKQMSFVALSVGRFEPRQVRMGLAGEDGMVQVLEGLAPGEAVVTSGQFLLDSESRLREAIQKYLNEKRQSSAVPNGQAGRAPTAATRPANGAPAARKSPARMQKVDAVVSAYLDISAALGAEQTNTTPIDVSALVTAAHVLHAELLRTKDETLAVDIAKAAEAMRGHPIDRQRELFKRLGETVVALVEAMPPSRALGNQVFVMECPMAPGIWIQRSDDLANPFYATEMKQCGSLLKAVTTTGGGEQ